MSNPVLLPIGTLVKISPHSEFRKQIVQTEGELGRVAYYREKPGWHRVIFPNTYENSYKAEDLIVCHMDNEEASTFLLSHPKNI